MYLGFIKMMLPLIVNLSQVSAIRTFAQRVAYKPTGI